MIIDLFNRICQPLRSTGTDPLLPYPHRCRAHMGVWPPSQDVACRRYARLGTANLPPPWGAIWQSYGHSTWTAPSTFSFLPISPTADLVRLPSTRISEDATWLDKSTFGPTFPVLLRPSLPAPFSIPNSPPLTVEAQLLMANPISEGRSV